MWLPVFGFFEEGWFAVIIRHAGAKLNDLCLISAMNDAKCRLQYEFRYGVVTWVKTAVHSSRDALSLLMAGYYYGQGNCYA